MSMGIRQILYQHRLPRKHRRRKQKLKPKKLRSRQRARRTMPQIQQEWCTKKALQKKRRVHTVSIR